jgi:uracil-DNA glycosylase family 4
MWTKRGQAPLNEMQTQDRLRQILIQRLESLQRAGVQSLRRPTRQCDSRSPATQSPESELEQVSPKVESAAQLAELNLAVKQCTLCQELAETRTQTVFGVGNPNARLCFFGEAPGADEDRQGEPFVGRAGKLLTDIIQKGMGLQRSDVYILNVLKCRPPGNRNPNNEEVTNCRPFFDKQLELIHPEFICCLGSVAAQSLLETKTPVGRLRGRFHDYRGIRVLVTYHPAYLLRNPSAKKDTWQDLKILMKAMGL